MTTIHSIRDEALGNISYLVELDEGIAISIDPRRDAGEHLATARDRGLGIVGVFETHLHADFVGGAHELASATGAEVYAAQDAGLARPYRPVRDGSRIAIGAASVEVIFTPGHTPEHLAFLLTANDTAALFSGGSMIVGGAARTDLTGTERTGELSRLQYASLQRLAKLPDEVALLPTHGAGSFCSTGPARSTSSTIGAERRDNPLLAARDEKEFVEILLAGMGSYPRYFAHLREVNQRGATPLGSLPAVPRLEAKVAFDAAERGTWLIDGRGMSEWARAYPQGAIAIEVRPAFASWLGWVVPFGDPFILMLEPSRLDEAVRLARLIGYDQIEGWTTFQDWRDGGLPVRDAQMLTPAQADARAREGALLLDVRQKSEWDASRIPGATHLEVGDIAAGATPGAPDEIVAYCGHGERSATATSLLHRAGFRVAMLDGGIGAWRRSGLPLDR